MPKMTHSIWTNLKMLAPWLFFGAQSSQIPIPKLYKARGAKGKSTEILRRPAAVFTIPSGESPFKS
uniref:Uncharacterized protein n=1 Tax=Rhizophora mucronata TaxID=61149 RepID=A0A2P2PI88_RHIMU